MFVAACGRVDFVPLGDGGSASGVDSPNGEHRIRLDLDRYTPIGPVDDLALRVSLDSSRFPRQDARSDLSDLRFELDGATLDYEIDAVDPVPEIWVHVPTVTGSPIYLYFGGQVQPASASVWSDSYIGVWHLDTADDSSPRQNNGAVTASTGTTGEIGPGLSVSGTGYVAIAAQSSTNWTSGHVTVSAWIRSEAFPSDAYATIVGRENGNGGADDFALGYASDLSVACDLVTGPDTNPSTDKITLNQWAHIAMTYDGANQIIYVDGTERLRTPATGALAQSNNPIHFGADSNSAPPTTPDGEFVVGRIDEVRLDSAARTAAWIGADYASQSDAWITYGPVE
jgi:hypothetical protein